MAKHTENKKKIQGKPRKGWVIPVVLLLAAIVVAAILIFTTSPKTEDLPANVSVSEAAERFAKGAFLLDVRQPEEWAEKHIEGAVLIPLGELESRMNEIPTDRDVLIICRSGNRSTQAREILRAAGYKRTTSVIGGINAWIAEGLPTISGN